MESIRKRQLVAATIPVALLALAVLVWCGSCRPRDDRSYFQKGMTLLDNKDDAAAAEAFQQALLRNDNVLSAHLQLGMMYERQQEQLVLAVWHYHAYLALVADGESAGGDEATAVKQWLERAERALLAALRHKLENTSDEERVMRVKLLEEHAQRQKNWITTLEVENRQLRQQLADAASKNARQ